MGQSDQYNWSKIGEYNVTGFLGRGGISFVYKVERFYERRIFALKIGYNGNFSFDSLTRLSFQSAKPDENGLQPDQMIALCTFLDRTFLGDFQSEINPNAVNRVLLGEYTFLLKYKNENIFPSPRDAFVHENSFCYVMDLLDGQDLRWKMRTSNFNVLPLIKKLLTKMSKTKNNFGDFYHGDIKPENIVEVNGDSFLIDPAMRIDNSKNDIAYTWTPSYNPFRIGCLESDSLLLGMRCDTFALSIIILECLIREKPFSMFLEYTDIEHENRMKILSTKQSDKEDIARFLNLDRFSFEQYGKLGHHLYNWLTCPPTYADMLRELNKL
jgi:serine/threonine protein kinase